MLCPPCHEICQKKLTCGNHKCQRGCHADPCGLCKEVVVLRCACKKTSITIKCGQEKVVERPLCELPCTFQVCHHQQQVHTCHFGECPLCTEPCLVKNECKHICSKPCHDPLYPVVPKPPPIFDGKEYISKRRLLMYEEHGPAKRMQVEQVQCPPCSIKVERVCKGKHNTFKKQCHTPEQFSCDSPCGNLLDCGNHDCQLQCHVISVHKKLSRKGNHVLKVPQEGEESIDEDAVDNCHKCQEPCVKQRPCEHICGAEGCHVGVCPQCAVVTKRWCFCKGVKLPLLCWQTVKRIQSQSVPLLRKQVPEEPQGMSPRVHKDLSSRKMQH